MNQDDRLMTADDVASLLGVARSTVFDWTRKGVLPSLVLHKGRFRAVRRWRAGDLRRFIESCCAPPVAATSGNR